MAGHSKWANIQHRKGRQDAKRAKVFTKLVREITVAARLGGADLDSNPRLRTAIKEARSASLPKDKMQKAIDKGTGVAGAEAIEEFIYEGYGPGGVAVMVEGFTDNRNRSAAEIRNIFARSGGNLGENGAVSWQFDRKGFMTVTDSHLSEDEMVEAIIDAGAEDYDTEDETWEVITDVVDLHTVASALEGLNLDVENVAPLMVPQTTMELGLDQAKKIVNMIDRFDDHDDVMKVWTNADPGSLAAAFED